MPWVEQNIMSMRKEFILLASSNEISFSEVCRRFGVSRKSGYKWLKRYQEHGDVGLSNRSSRPQSIPKFTDKNIVKEIITIREKHPTWGGRKIRHILLRREIGYTPAASTISKVLKSHGLIDKKKRENSAQNRFEHKAPNHLWQMDFKGHFAFEQGRCHPLTILDDHSRYSILLTACINEKKETVQANLIEAFKRYGLPKRINTDNGAPWGSSNNSIRYTELSVWLIKLGVIISYSRPHHPQTNGKDERFHRTLKEDVINRKYFKDMADIQRVFDEWRECYNIERPHEGINMHVPADRYLPSYRSYNDKIKDYNYCSSDILRKSDTRGRIRFEKRGVFIGTAFASETVAMRPSKNNDCFNVFFCGQKIGELNLAEVDKSQTINLYTKQILY